MRAPEPALTPPLPCSPTMRSGSPSRAARSDKLPTRPAAHVPPPIKSANDFNYSHCRRRSGAAPPAGGDDAAFRLRSRNRRKRRTGALPHEPGWRPADRPARARSRNARSRRHGRSRTDARPQAHDAGHRSNREWLHRDGDFRDARRRAGLRRQAGRRRAAANLDQERLVDRRARRVSTSCRPVSTSTGRSASSARTS